MEPIRISETSSANLIQAPCKTPRIEKCYTKNLLHTTSRNEESPEHEAKLVTTENMTFDTKTTAQSRNTSRFLHTS
jgi:hypothetical protein